MSVGVAWFPDFGHIVADIFFFKAVNKTLQIAVGISMVNMEELSRTGVLSTTSWMRMVWNDFR